MESMETIKREEVLNLKTIKQAKDLMEILKIEVKDITQQINDYKELLILSKDIDTELEVDPNWIVKAQQARRHKLTSISEIDLWIETHKQDNKISNTDLNKLDKKYTQLKLMYDNLEQSLKSEKQKRTNVTDELRNQTGFLLRSVRELYLFITHKNSIIPITQNKLEWVDTVIKNNPNSLLSLNNK
jgi:ElaB/YqjD/DUF883 family membrane-anchored ribosome-binding protein